MSKIAKDFCEKYGFKYVEVTYSFRGIKDRRKGFDIVMPDGKIVFEPKNLIHHKEKWYVHSHIDGHTYSFDYIVRVTEKLLEKFAKMDEDRLYYFCKYDGMGQRTGDYHSIRLTRRQALIERKNGSYFYLSELAVQAAAWS
jgi:hypothetical protein